MDDIFEISKALIVLVLWKFCSRTDPYIWAYFHYLMYGVYLRNTDSTAVSACMIGMAASAFIFDAIEVCSRAACCYACQETLTIGSLYVLLLLGVHCNVKLRSCLFPERCSKCAAILGSAGVPRPRTENRDFGSASIFPPELSAQHTSYKHDTDGRPITLEEEPIRQTPIHLNCRWAKSVFWSFPGDDARSFPPVSTPSVQS